MDKIIPRSKKIRTSITLDEDTWKKFQYYCSLKKTNASKYLMKLIEKELEEQEEDFKHRAKREREEIHNMFSKNSKKNK